MILSPTFAVIVGLLSGSPGKALNAKVLKSLLSINDNDELISTPVKTTEPEPLSGDHDHLLHLQLRDLLEEA